MRMLLQPHVEHQSQWRTFCESRRAAKPPLARPCAAGSGQRAVSRIDYFQDCFTPSVARRAVLTGLGAALLAGSLAAPAEAAAAPTGSAAGADPSAAIAELQAAARQAYAGWDGGAVDGWSAPSNALRTPACTAVAAFFCPRLSAVHLLVVGVCQHPLPADRNFVETVQLLNQIVDLEPREPRWREMRAQVRQGGPLNAPRMLLHPSPALEVRPAQADPCKVSIACMRLCPAPSQALVDGKNFTDALRDFDSALRLLPPDASVDRARLLSGGDARTARSAAATVPHPRICVVLFRNCMLHPAGHAPRRRQPTSELKVTTTPPSSGHSLALCCGPATPAGRGLAFEGLAAWPEALKDYDEALALADAAGLLPDPYILNSRGNCHASLGEAPGSNGGVGLGFSLRVCVYVSQWWAGGRGGQACRRSLVVCFLCQLFDTKHCLLAFPAPPSPAGEWQAARDNFLASAEGFQRASGFRYGRSTTPRLDGAVFAASNAGGAGGGNVVGHEGRPAVRGLLQRLGHKNAWCLCGLHLRALPSPDPARLQPSCWRSWEMRRRP